MKHVKLLALLICAALLAAGCSKPYKVTDKIPTNTCEAPETVASYAEPEQPVVEAPVVEVAAAPQAFLQRIHFDFDQFVLTPEARAVLQENARYMELNPSTSIAIEGHCDERGSDEYNLALGERRATAAAQYLTALGVAADRIRTISYGEEMPLDATSSEAAWALNRRAEFKPQP
ncbi:MAG: peptidoglycan-associated lipoprotein Pal [Desulfuromonadaceae bacterium]|nr:peptidoglycan-associated lipoprotein Pal [Desulfuromonadaceae bacterium]